MAYKFIGNNPAGFPIYAGPTADRPTAGSQDGAAGLEYWHTDSASGKRERSDGTKWIEITSGGGTMSSTAFASGSLGGATLVVVMAGAPLPATVILDSSDGTRKIQWSADGGFEYFDAVYDYTNANELVFIVDAPVTHIKFTGLTADTYRIG